MTPEQIKLCIQLAIVAAIAAAGFAGGWVLNGWRLGAQLEHAQGERDRAIDQGVVLAGGLKACNAGVDAAKSAGDQVRGLLGQLLAEVRKQNAPQQEAIQRIEQLLKEPTPAGAGCDAAWALLEAQRKARGPQ